MIPGLTRLAVLANAAYPAALLDLCRLLDWNICGLGPSVAHTQQSNSIRRIGLLMMYPENDPQGQLRARAFEREIEKAGWKVGKNLQIDFHWGTGDADWVRSAAAHMLHQAPDVMLANGDAAGKAAQQLTRTVPIIVIAGGDPVGDGFVQSLAHPVGNVTGFAVMELSLGAKLLGMLKQVAPRVTRVCTLVNPDNPTHQRILALLAAAAPKFAVEVVKGPAREPAQIHAAMAQWGQESDVGLIVLPDPSTNAQSSSSLNWRHVTGCQQSMHCAPPLSMVD